MVGDNLLYPRLHPLLSDPASDPLAAAAAAPKPSFFSLRGLLGEGFGIALQTLLVILVPSYLILPAFIGQPLVSLLVSLSGTLLPSYLSLVVGSGSRAHLWIVWRLRIRHAVHPPTLPLIHLPRMGYRPQAIVREDLWLARKQAIYWVVMVLTAVLLQALGLGRTYSDPAKEEASRGLLGWLPFKPLFQVGFYFWVGDIQEQPVHHVVLCCVCLISFPLLVGRPLLLTHSCSTPGSRAPSFCSPAAPA